MSGTLSRRIAAAEARIRPDLLDVRRMTDDELRTRILGFLRKMLRSGELQGEDGRYVFEGDASDPLAARFAATLAQPDVQALIAKAGGKALQ